MARLLVTIWFALASLPGPGVCCCTLLRLPVRPSSPTNHNAPSDTAKGCCCSDEAPREPPAPAGETPAPHTCPCKRSACPATLVVPSKSLEQGPAQPLPPEPGPPAAPASPAGGPRFLREGDVLLPFHPTSELLRGHHQLRC